MEIRIVIDGISFEFDDYTDLREILDERCSVMLETDEDNGVYFP